MFGVLSIAVVAALVMLWRETSADDQPSKMSSQLEKLWNISLGALREKKYLRADLLSGWSAGQGSPSFRTGDQY